MTPDRFQCLRNLFEAALEQENSDRAVFVAQSCGDDEDLRREVSRLLQAHDATVTLSSPAPRTDPSAREGRRVGDYQILRELGRGGMGSVYLARRADAAFQKTVAIKILRADCAGSDILHRFHREREILAQLDHPNIARLLDAGETEDGLPYFVMEYVEGRTITQYADERRLPIPDRIALFRQVCDAVDYAHQRKVIHRDLKPGNVLVTAGGQVKLLDFGIAHFVEPGSGALTLTRTGMWLMTPEYASPEQVRGEAAGRASDVYSLGVILFELLTGHRPYRLRSRVFHEIMRVVCEEAPGRPSAVVTQPVETTTEDGKPATLPPETTGRLRQISLSGLKQQLSGDLDNILLKALDKQPVKRYSSVLQFGADLDRHGSGEAVWARSYSRMSQAGRFLSQYRIALVVVAVLAASVASGTVTLRWSALWWLALGAALAGVWKTATDPKTGRTIAQSSVSKFGLAILLGGSGWLAIWRPAGWGGAVFAINLVLAIVALSLVAAWLFRSSWAGPLTLDIGESLEAQRLGRIITFTMLPYNIISVMLPKIRAHKGMELSDFAILAWLIFAIALIWVSARQEIRRNGFISRGRLIPWSRISSWVWEDAEDPGPITAPLSRPMGDPVLALHLHHAVNFLPPVRFRIGKSQKADINAILARQLGEWPAGD